MALGLHCSPGCPGVTAQLPTGPTLIGSERTNGIIKAEIDVILFPFCGKSNLKGIAHSMEVRTLAGSDNSIAGLLWSLLNTCDNLRELQVYPDSQGPHAWLERQLQGRYHVVISKTWAAASPTLSFWQPRFRGKTQSLGQRRWAGRTVLHPGANTWSDLVSSLCTEPSWTALLSSGQCREKPQSHQDKSVLHNA